MKYHILLFSKIRKDVAKFVVCCSHDWHLKAKGAYHCLVAYSSLFSVYYLEICSIMSIICFHALTGLLFNCLNILLANMSQRLMVELIVYQSLRC